MDAIKRSNEDLHCGGSITSKTTIVTAAHCFMDKSTGKKVEKILEGSLDAIIFTFSENSNYWRESLFEVIKTLLEGEAQNLPLG